MENTTKTHILLNCNNIPNEDIYIIYSKGEISLEEFKNAGLAADKIKFLEHAMDAQDRKTKEEAKSDEIIKKKADVLNKITKGRLGAESIKGHINSKMISYDDLEDAGLSSSIVRSLKHYCSSERIRRPRTIDELPPMQEGRTDVYFIGVAGSGKSTMLAGLLKTADKRGISLPDPLRNNDGAIYQTGLIHDLNKGVLPLGTQKGTYNYVALSLRDEKGKNHPFNIVDVPGENYKDMVENAEVEKLLKYINNSNKKILIFVIDSLAHDGGYSDSPNQLDQSMAYVNILQMFASNGILEQTDALYLIANKYDAIKERKYPFDDRQNGDIALDYLREQFLNLIENCKAVRKGTKNDFKIKIMPFSIGSISHDYILNSLNVDFSSTLLNQLLLDSFTIRGGTSKMFN